MKGVMRLFVRCVMFLSAVLRITAAVAHTAVSGFIRTLSPAQLVFGGYLTYILAGWLLLLLPICRASAKPGALDHLFTVLSAVSTTGLTTISISSSYTILGQLVILALIQLGGIGYMTLGSFIVLSRKPDLPPLREKVGQAVFSLPASFDLHQFIRSVVTFTLVIETATAAALYLVFRQAGVEHPLYSAVFHSVSSFCTAGFSLYDDSMMSFAGNVPLHLAVGLSSYLGAIGFIVCLDYWNKWAGRTKSITLTSRIIMGATFWLSLAGTLLLFVAEPSIKATPVHERLLAAFFQTMSALTTVGFNTIDIGSLSKASVLLLTVFMVIGASPSGTGGGIKVTTFSAVLGVIRSAARGEGDVRFWGRVIPFERVWMAVASFGLYLFVLMGGLYLLNLTEPTPFDKNLFEAASALGTVGLSMGITAGLTAMGKLTIILLMFIGRVGPMTFGAALFVRIPEKQESEPSDSDLAV